MDKHLWNATVLIPKAVLLYALECDVQHALEFLNEMIVPETDSSLLSRLLFFG